MKAYPRPLSIGRPFLCISALAVLAGLLPAMTAHGGTVLIARESVLEAGLDSGFVLGGTARETGFDRFADDVNTGGEAPAAVAQQYSVPGVGEAGLAGAFAEGSVKAGLGGDGSSAWAQSTFLLRFRVEEQPTAYTIGAALGAEGPGSALLELLSLSSSPQVGGGGTDHAVLSVKLVPGEDGAQVVNEEGTLEPGLYQLTLFAEGTDDVADNETASAYYNLNVNFASAPGGAHSVPLPPPVWSALATVGGVVALRGVRRLRQKAAWRKALAGDSLQVISTAESADVEALTLPLPALRRAA